MIQFVLNCTGPQTVQPVMLSVSKNVVTDYINAGIPFDRNG
jgi:hypothetical protein